MPGSIQVTTPPTSSLRIVDLTTVKSHCRIDSSADDTLLDTYILAAQGLIENETGLRLFAQTVNVLFDQFSGSREMILPVAPVNSITGLSYYDGNGTLTALTPGSDFTSSVYGTTMGLGRVQSLTSWPMGMTVWPGTQRRLDAVVVACTVGWADAASVPAALRLASLLLIGHWYNNRDAVGQIGSEIAIGFCSLVDPYRINFGT